MFLWTNKENYPSIIPFYMELCNLPGFREVFSLYNVTFSFSKAVK